MTTIFVVGLGLGLGLACGFVCLCTYLKCESGQRAKRWWSGRLNERCGRGWGWPDFQPSGRGGGGAEPSGGTPNPHKGLN